MRKLDWVVWRSAWETPDAVQQSSHANELEVVRHGRLWSRKPAIDPCERLGRFALRLEHFARLRQSSGDSSDFPQSSINAFTSPR